MRSNRRPSEVGLSCATQFAVSSLLKFARVCTGPDHLNEENILDRFESVLLLAALLSILPFQEPGAVPRLMNYQGTLADESGIPLPDGNYSVTFRIWDSEIGGQTLWAEGQLMTVQRGLFSVLLGAVVEIPDSIFPGSNRWLGIQVGIEDEVFPRTRLVSTAYSWRAHSAQNADTAAFSLDKTVDASELSTGALDTARYSAFLDLLSETRIGDQANQIAPGDHSHIGAYAGVFSDASVESFTVAPGDGETAVKSVILPFPEVPTYLRIIALVRKTVNGPAVEWRLRLNGQAIYSLGLTGEGFGIAGTTLLFDGATSTWYSRPDYQVFWCPAGVAASGLTAPLLLEITAENSGAVPVMATAGRVVIEYD